MEPHSPDKRKGLPWLVCRKCGLIYLRNALTRFCIKHGCDHEQHPGYQHAKGMVNSGHDRD